MQQAFLLVVFVAISTSAAVAQVDPSTVARDEQKTAPATTTKIIVEVRRLIGATNLNARLCGIRALPVANSFSVRNDWQTLGLVFIADRRANESAIEHPGKFTLQSGKSQTWAPLGRSLDASENDAIRVVYLPGQKVFRLQLAWGKHKAGEDALRPITATVPIDSDLLINVGTQYVDRKTLAHDIGFFEYYFCWLFNIPQRTETYQEPVDGYLLVSPRVVPES